MGTAASLPKMIPPTNLTSLDKSVLILSTCLAATGVVLFALRAYAARKMNGKWRADFIWVSVAMALALGCYACLVAAFFYGLGHQLLEISYPQLQTAIKLTFAYLLMNITATATAKLGIVALIVSIQNPSQWQRIRFLWGVGVFQVIVNIVLQLCIIFACDPVTKLWNPLASGHCNIETTFVNYSVFQGGESLSSENAQCFFDTNTFPAASGIVDLILGLWPISMMTVVKSSRKAKFGFCLLISLGIVPGAVSMYRALITRRVVQGWDVSCKSLDPTSQPINLFVPLTSCPLRQLHSARHLDLRRALAHHNPRISDDAPPPLPPHHLGLRRRT